MLKIAIFFGLFLAFMLYRVIVNYQGREVTAPSRANVKDDLTGLVVAAWLLFLYGIF